MNKRLKNSVLCLLFAFMWQRICILFPVSSCLVYKIPKKVLVDGLDTECKRMLQELAEEYRFQILAMEVMLDRIHLLVDCRKQKQQKTEIQKRKLREMIVCRLHPVMV